MCKQSGMTISDYRKANSLTLEAMAAAVGIRSKGQMSGVERTNRCSVKLALAIEAHTNGRVDAATLNADVAAARKVAA